MMVFKSKKLNVNALQKILAPLFCIFLMAGCNENQKAEKLGCVLDSDDYTQVGYSNDIGECNTWLYVKKREHADSGVIAQLDAYTSTGHDGYVNWVQVDGPMATIINGDTLNAQVLMPYVQEAQTLSFEVTINDDDRVAAGVETITVLPLDAPFRVETPVVNEQSSVIALAVKGVPEGTLIYVDVMGGTAVRGVDFDFIAEEGLALTVENQMLNIPVVIWPNDGTVDRYITLVLALPNGELATANVVIAHEDFATVSSYSSSQASSEFAAMSSQSSAVFTSSSSSVSEVPENFVDACHGIMPLDINYPERIANPYIDADLYVDPDFETKVASTQSTVNDDELRAAMELVKTQSTAVWVESSEKLCGTPGDGRLNLVEHIEHAKSGLNESPLTMTLTLYNIPGREFGTRATGAGDFDITAQGELGYREFIDATAAIMASAPELRFTILLEPHALAKLADEVVARGDNTSPEKIKAYEAYYKNNIAYALWRFSQIPNSFVYLDVSNPIWVDLDLKEAAIVNVASEIQSLAADFAGEGDVQFSGFVANTLNYIPYEEPFVSQEYRDSYSRPSALSTITYIDKLRQLANDFPNLPSNFLVDSSRNGWGGPDRPTQIGDTSAFRLDRRNSRMSWCNLKAAGLGEFPSATPDPGRAYVQAFYWFKPPGESDGMETNDRYGCSSSFALPNPPAGGEWFDAHFIQLIEYSWPRLLSAPDSVTAKLLFTK